MKITIGRNPLDVKVTDNNDVEVNFPISSLSFHIRGGQFPILNLEIELFQNTELTIADFDLQKEVGRLLSEREMLEKVVP